MKINYCLIFVIILLGCTKPIIEEEKHIVNGIQYDFVKVDSGTFEMGCSPSFLQKYDRVLECSKSELPVHTRHVKNFYIGKYKVTYEQFKSFIQETNYKTTSDRYGGLFFYIEFDEEVKNMYKNGKQVPYTKILRTTVNGYEFYDGFVSGVNWEYSRDLEKYDTLTPYPVIYISWEDADAFCQWFSKKIGKDVHLPTDVQWEYTARGGKYSNNYAYAGSNDFEDVGQDSVLEKI